MSEATTSGEILRVEVKDEDTDPDNRAFVFSLQPPSNHFIVRRDMDYAVISVNPVRMVNKESSNFLLHQTNIYFMLISNVKCAILFVLFCKMYLVFEGHSQNFRITSAFYSL